MSLQERQCFRSGPGMLAAQTLPTTSLQAQISDAPRLKLDDISERHMAHMVFVRPAGVFFATCREHCFSSFGRIPDDILGGASLSAMFLKACWEPCLAGVFFATVLIALPRMEGFQCQTTR